LENIFTFVKLARKFIRYDEAAILYKDYQKGIAASSGRRSFSLLPRFVD
jgi:hypothetical protein